jgi:hypothetical protein
MLSEMPPDRSDEMRRDGLPRVYRTTWGNSNLRLYFGELLAGWSLDPAGPVTGHILPRPDPARPTAAEPPRRHVRTS